MKNQIALLNARPRAKGKSQDDFKKDIKVGTKVYFESEVRPYTVKAVGKRYAICTKPYNLQKTVLYTILDFDEGVRGPSDLVFNIWDYRVQVDIDKCLSELKKGSVGVSRRRSIDLDIIRVATSQPAPICNG